MGKQQFLFISPHLDDAVLSCGGYIGKLQQYDFPVSVLTLFSGSPEGRLSLLARKLHRDWRLPKDAPAVRREEDQHALGILGAEARHANFLDCIYRRDIKGRFLYKRISQVLKQSAVQEISFVKKVAGYLLETIKNGKWNVVYAPLALGGHIDHHITRAAVLRVRQAFPEIIFHFYEDLPYVISDSREPKLGGAKTFPYLCLSELQSGIKYAAMQAYQSQIKCSEYPTGIDIDAIRNYGLQVGKEVNRFAERVWYNR